MRYRTFAQLSLGTLFADALLTHRVMGAGASLVALEGRDDLRLSISVAPDLESALRLM